ncbi:hypothetical protein RQM59_08515 [Flavobacteriaceae bacterium S356]|uniref:DUF4177 domain-containing protein n=1 Tax=Asprobacillus argus TaxID=3076534 RepID=A0ABU3LFC4_9FLAO|nr:hypothetical protein [Flavobacteriaceae bacterium S356]
MKKLLLGGLVVISFIALSFTVKKQKVEYKTITVVESIIPSGIGRSRMISAEEVKNYRDYTSTRSSDKKKDKRNKSSRSGIRVKNFEETKLLNFFNLGGIRFQNIAANDALVDSKINAMAEEGWELAFVNSGVESFGGKGDSNGIYVTRYVFKRTN